MVRFIKLSSPHLMLANVGYNNGFAVGKFIKLVDDVLHFETALPFEFEREFLFPAVEFLEPLGGVQFGHMRHEFIDNLEGIADAVDVGLNHFSNFRRVDIDMNNLRLFAEFFGVAQNSVIKARADVDEQVALANGFIGIGTPVHPEPSEGKFVRFGEGALSEQGGRDWGIQFFRQFSQRILRAGNHGAVTR